MHKTISFTVCSIYLNIGGLLYSYKRQLNGRTYDSLIKTAKTVREIEKEFGWNRAAKKSEQHRTKMTKYTEKWRPSWNVFRCHKKQWAREQENIDQKVEKHRKRNMSTQKRLRFMFPIHINDELNVKINCNTTTSNQSIVQKRTGKREKERTNGWF